MSVNLDKLKMQYLNYSPYFITVFSARLHENLHLLHFICFLTSKLIFTTALPSIALKSKSTLALSMNMEMDTGTDARVGRDNDNHQHLKDHQLFQITQMQVTQQQNGTIWTRTRLPPPRPQWLPIQIHHCSTAGHRPEPEQLQHHIRLVNISFPR